MCPILGLYLILIYTTPIKQAKEVQNDLRDKDKKGNEKDENKE